VTIHVNNEIKRRIMLYNVIILPIMVASSCRHGLLRRLKGCGQSHSSYRQWKVMNNA